MHCSGYVVKDKFVLHRPAATVRNVRCMCIVGTVNELLWFAHLISSVVVFNVVRFEKYVTDTNLPSGSRQSAALQPPPARVSTASSAASCQSSSAAGTEKGLQDFSGNVTGATCLCLGVLMSCA